MLLWERLGKGKANTETGKHNAQPVVKQPELAMRSKRLPYDVRCAARAKAGHRCHCRIIKGSEFCLFHDPVASARLREKLRQTPPRVRRLMNLPSGYLRKMTSVRSVAAAMDQLYRELRTGLITPEMATHLLTILGRLLDSGLLTGAPHAPQRTKAHRMRLHLSDVLARGERKAWRLAVATAPAAVLRSEEEIIADAARALPAPTAEEAPRKRQLTAS